MDFVRFLIALLVATVIVGMALFLTTQTALDWVIPTRLMLTETFRTQWSVVLDWPDFLQTMAWYAFLLTEVWFLWLFIPLWLLLFLYIRTLLRRGYYENLKEQVYVQEHNLQTVTQRDIDQREQLATLHDSLMQAWETYDTGLLLLAADNIILDANNAAKDLLTRLQMAPGLILRRRIQDMLPDWEPSGLAAEVTQVRHGEAQATDTFQLGESRVQARIFKGAQGMYIWLRDISHHQHRENEQEQAMAQLNMLVANLPDPTLLVAADGQPRGASQAWQQQYASTDPTPNLWPAPPAAWPEWLQAALSGQSTAEQRTEEAAAGDQHTLWQVSPWRDAYNKIIGAVVVARDVTARVRAESRLAQHESEESHLAYHDSLTDLPNRQLFNDRLGMALATAYRNMQQVAVFFLDLDGFKPINDQLGHDVGDMLLQSVAQRLTTNLRRADTVARLGGDEFTIIAFVKSEADCVTIAQKVIDVINAPHELAGHQDIRVSTSIGISIYPTHGANPADLLRKADEAMYIAKNSGKNQYIFFEDKQPDTPQAQAKDIAKENPQDMAKPPAENNAGDAPA